MFLILTIFLFLTLVFYCFIVSKYFFFSNLILSKRSKTNFKRKSICNRRKSSVEILCRQLPRYGVQTPYGCKINIYSFLLWNERYFLLMEILYGTILIVIPFFRRGWGRNSKQLSYFSFSEPHLYQLI